MGTCQAHPPLWGASHPKSQLALPEEWAKFGNEKPSPGLAIGILPAFVQRGDGSTYCPLVPWGKLQFSFLLSSPAFLAMSLVAHLLGLF